MRTLAMIGLGIFGIMLLQKNLKIAEKLRDLNSRGIAVAGFNNFLSFGGCDYKKMSVEELKQAGC